MDQDMAGAEDIAGPVVMLLDPASRVITGETVLLDAGAHLDVGLSRRPGREGRLSSPPCLQGGAGGGWARLRAQKTPSPSIERRPRHRAPSAATHP